MALGEIVYSHILEKSPCGTVIHAFLEHTRRLLTCGKLLLKNSRLYPVKIIKKQVGVSVIKYLIAKLGYVVGVARIVTGNNVSSQAIKVSGVE